MIDQMHEKTARRLRILDLLRMLDGFLTDEIAGLACCTIEQARDELEGLSTGGFVRREFKPGRGFAWFVNR